MTRILCCSLTRFYFCKFITVFLFMTFLYVSYKTIEYINHGAKLANMSPWSFDRSKNKSENTINIDDNLPKSNLQYLSFSRENFINSCPICFGTIICDNIDIGALTISDKKQVQSGKTVHKGTWHKSTTVQVKLIDKDLLHRYKQFMCQNITKSASCPTLGSEIYFNKVFFNVDQVRNIYTLTLQQRSDIPAVLCATEKLIAHLKIVYDLDGDGKTSNDELLMLHTSLAVNPEALVHTFLSKSSINLPIPYFYGVCGQVLVIEESYTPLTEYLKDEFSIRAGLAVQILQIVEDFLEEDPDWLFLFSDFSFKNLAVKEDGDVILTDVTNLAIIDKSLTIPDDKSSKNDKLCNEACYRLYTSDLYSSGNTNRACSRISHISHMMYALVCQNILSDLEEHKSNRASSTISKGLLHSIPDKDRQVLEDLLHECIKETSAGGRMQAAEELKDLLGEYMSDDDVEVDDDDDDENDSYDVPKEEPKNE